MSKSTVDGQNPFHTTWKPWLKPLRCLLEFAGEANPSRFLRWCDFWISSTSMTLDGVQGSLFFAPSPPIPPQVLFTCPCTPEKPSPHPHPQPTTAPQLGPFLAPKKITHKKNNNHGPSPCLPTIPTQPLVWPTTCAFFFSFRRNRGLQLGFAPLQGTYHVNPTKEGVSIYKKRK